VRWLGHRLIAELHADVTADLPTAASHEIAEQVRHTLLHEVPGLSEVLVHIDPFGHSPEHYHQTTWHHRR
jgi:divalent metal cation (Fe/Co/Zn/Cd) transporter